MRLASRQLHADDYHAEAMDEQAPNLRVSRNVHSFYRGSHIVLSVYPVRSDVVRSSKSIATTLTRCADKHGLYLTRSMQVRYRYREKGRDRQGAAQCGISESLHSFMWIVACVLCVRMCSNESAA